MTVRWHTQQATTVGARYIAPVAATLIIAFGPLARGPGAHPSFVNHQPISATLVAAHRGPTTVAQEDANSYQVATNRAHGVALQSETPSNYSTSNKNSDGATALFGLVVAGLGYAYYRYRRARRSRGLQMMRQGFDLSQDRRIIGGIVSRWIGGRLIRRGADLAFPEKNKNKKNDKKK